MKESREIGPPAKAELLELDRPFEPHVVMQTGRYPNYRETEAREGLQLMDYWRAIRKRIWLVVGIAVLASTLAAIYMARRPNIYAARSVVQVDQEQVNPELATERQRPLLTSDPSYFNTQLQILGSDSLLRRVIKEHNLDTNPEFQRAKNEAGTSTFRSMLKAIGLVREGPKPVVKTGEDENTNSLISPEEIAEAVRLAPYVDVIKRNLSIEPVRDSRMTVKDTRLIDVAFISGNAELSAKVANGIAETFANYNQEKRSGASRKTSDFLEERIQEIQAEIRSGEIELVELSKKVGVVKTTGEQTIVGERLSGLNEKLLNAENERKNAEAQYFAVRNAPERLRSVVEEASARYITERENAVQALRTDIEKQVSGLRSKREALLVEYRETAPEIREIDTQIESLNDSVKRFVDKTNGEIQTFRDRAARDTLNNLETKYRSTKSAEDEIRRSFDQQFAAAQGQGGGAVSIELLRQTIDANKGFLKQLRDQQSGNAVSSQGSGNNVSIASPAIPNDQPVGPRRLATVLGTMLLSTLFGMGLALFLEYLDDTISSVEEAERVLQLPALAAIPTIDAGSKRKLLVVGSDDTGEDGSRSSELLIYTDPRSGMAESYRQLRTSILLSTAGHAPKSLLITSSLPSEGKTTTATNTAISLAQTGASVVIIDADMRRPRLHSVFDLTNGEGLSTLLSSEATEADITRVVKREEASGLNILTSGPIPPNPAELIGSEQMASLLRKLQSQFNHVVIDSPPITSFTDGVLIASMVDGVILVVHSGKSSRQVVRRARMLLQDVGARVLGVVLNNVDLRSQENYHYYQSYYGRSGYRTDGQE